MSDTPKKKSSCCGIGCIVLLIAAIGLTFQVLLPKFKELKTDLNHLTVISQTDPAADADAQTFFPEKVGTFTRGAIDVSTSDPQTVITSTKYTSSSGKDLNISVAKTDPFLADTLRKATKGMKSKVNANTVNGKSTISWSGPNWTFNMKSDDSALASEFIRDFRLPLPGNAAKSATEPAADSATATPL